MKVFAINGSARSKGNTKILIEKVFEPLKAEGIETEILSLAGKTIHGCRACYNCFSAETHRCTFDNDVVNECIGKMLEADGIILASPTYFADISAELKAVIDRAGLVAKANGDLLARKVGAAVVAVRRGGSIHAYDSINHFFGINQMIVPGSCYWNMGIGREVGEVEGDEEGMKTMTVLGENMAWLLKKING
jgi:multimeric flavodoxin WrbA